MPRELDDVDRGILYELQREARNTTAQEIADLVGVSPGAVRNRIERLEAGGVVIPASTSVPRPTEIGGSTDCDIRITDPRSCGNTDPIVLFGRTSGNVPEIRKIICFLREQFIFVGMLVPGMERRFHRTSQSPGGN
jgi:DNA-binding Lrp family transcriptional regulator